MWRYLLFAFGCLLLWTAVGCYWFSGWERRQVDELIARVEEYARVHGRLPDPNDETLMGSLGFELRTGWHPDYKPGEGGAFVITLWEGFDGPYWTWDSSSRTWSEKW
ncbi:MAG TPA: hypothetical protein VD994_16930 [Prosthecobacter sp.]|nr:hypothetical protein [Prosthecobacter sp.]